MKTLMLLAASALALGACSPKSAVQRASLDCPASEGKLSRVSKSADGKACVYRGDDDTDVSLSLLAVNGDVGLALKGVEDGLLPAPNEAEQVAVTASKDAGIHIDSDDNGGDDKVDIDIPGVRIVADNDKAAIKIGGMMVDAGGDGAVVRSQEDVRLKGEAMSRERRGIRASYLRAGKNLPGDWRYVGYEAAGPKSGPLAVATVHSKSGHDNGMTGLNGDVKKLVRLNGGV
jgi:hypothetical protein